MSRYGIAEWYGRRFLTLTPAERQTLAEMAVGDHAPPRCPFRPMVCNKSGGVCSIQPYTDSGGHIAGTDGPPVITCPTRFDQDSMIVRWLAEIVGFAADEVKLAREVPFMESSVTRKPAGKIDLVVASDRTGLQWFGLEIQAVYFSGPV